MTYPYTQKKRPEPAYYVGPYDEGKRAYPNPANPYSIFTDKYQHLSWQAGWEHSQQQEARSRREALPPDPNSEVIRIDTSVDPGEGKYIRYLINHFRLAGPINPKAMVKLYVQGHIRCMLSGHQINACNVETDRIVRKR